MAWDLKEAQVFEAINSLKIYHIFEDTSITKSGGSTIIQLEGIAEFLGSLRGLQRGGYKKSRSFGSDNYKNCNIRSETFIFINYKVFLDMSMGVIDGSSPKLP